MPESDTVVAQLEEALGAKPAGGAARVRLALCLDEALQLPGVDVRACELLHRKLTELTFNLVVVGQFKRGKSSVINALLGEGVLPTGVVPLTSIVTAIRHGPTAMARVEHHDGREQRIPVAALESYVTERGNPDNSRQVRHVRVDHPSSWLADGVHLVDTPGIGSVYQHNTDVTQQYLPQADAVLFIASVDQPLGSAELEFLAGIRRYADKVICVLNKIDYLDAQELDESLAFATRQVHSTLGTETPLFAVSAKLALQGKRGAGGQTLARSGFPLFERELARFMTEEKETIWSRSIARRLLRILSELRFALELERRLLSAPQLEIEDKVAAFTRRRAEVQRSGADHQVLLEADARTLLRTDIEPALAGFAQQLGDRITAAIAGWYAQMQSLSSRKLQEALENRLIAEVRSAYDEWLQLEDARLQRAFETLCERSWTTLQGVVDDLMRYSSKLFSVAFEAVSTDAHWSGESGFYYKFWYEPASLKILTASFVLALPKSVAGRLILRRAQARALELVEVQAGRIRHDLEERLKSSVRDANRQIAQTVDSILERIDGAMDSGSSMRSRSQPQVAARECALAQQIGSALELEAHVRALAP